MKFAKAQQRWLASSARCDHLLTVSIPCVRPIIDGEVVDSALRGFRLSVAACHKRHRAYIFKHATGQWQELFFEMSLVWVTEGGDS